MAAAPSTLSFAVELRTIDSIRPYPDNPRLNDAAVDAVASSIRTFGWRVPIVVDCDGVIVAGHTRFKAAVKLGLAEVPVHVAAELTPAQAKAYRLADNQTASLASWDDGKLVAELLSLQEQEFDLGLTGFTADELSELLAPEPNEFAGDPDDVPEPPVEPITQPGDLWLLGRHRLLCGDSTKAADVERLMAGAKADMLLSDPPYGVAYVGKTKDALTVENDALDEEGLSALVSAAFDLAQAHCRPGAYWYATVPAGPLHLLFAHDWKRRGILRQIMVWVKDSMVLGHSEYHYQHEPILFGWIPGDRHKNADRTRTTLWQYDRPKASREHPTMKPVALWSQAITDGSRPGELVYDPFLGSGTTLIAAEQLGRTCCGMEISPQYCDVIVQRFETLSSTKAERVPTGDEAEVPA
ncbi:MAG: ParB N-terminal domain-containing protein [Gemmataceae bacterium]|nr:ParB N-terminal domain-containing protein [Gemmataceae bacterium]